LNQISIRGKAIGPAGPPYIIAEIGTNHNRNIDTAKQMIAEIAASGCDCVKFQIYEPDEIVSKSIRASDYGLDGVYGDISAHEMFDKYLKTPKEWFPELKNICHHYGMACGVTVHGSNGITWANATEFDFIKVASMDHTNLPFLHELVDRINRPVLVSFGLAELEDVKAAISILEAYQHGYGVFHCCAIYPPEPDEVRLENIAYLIKHTNVPVGFSDHTMGTDAALEAKSLGAVIFEKHVTLSRKSTGPDHPLAMEMDELVHYVTAVKNAKTISKDNIGESFTPLSSRELEKRPAYLKSIIARRDLPAGYAVQALDVYLARPGTGLQPGKLEWILNRSLAKAVNADQPLQLTDFGN